MKNLRYLTHYPEHLQKQVQSLIDKEKLSDYLLANYPDRHSVTTDSALYDFTIDLKQQFMRKSSPISRVTYDGKIHVIDNALGQHRFISRVQGGKLKAKNEIKIAKVFKNSPEAFLSMIVVHELAHLKEKEHNKAFYKLCHHMLPSYHQYEFDMRVYLTYVEMNGALYGR